MRAETTVRVSVAVRSRHSAHRRRPPRAGADRATSSSTLVHVLTPVTQGQALQSQRRWLGPGSGLAAASDRMPRQCPSCSWMVAWCISASSVQTVDSRYCALHLDHRELRTGIASRAARWRVDSYDPHRAWRWVGGESKPRPCSVHGTAVGAAVRGGGARSTNSGERAAMDCNQVGRVAVA